MSQAVEPEAWPEVTPAVPEVAAIAVEAREVAAQSGNILGMLRVDIENMDRHGLVSYHTIFTSREMRFIRTSSTASSIT